MYARTHEKKRARTRTRDKGKFESLAALASVRPQKANAHRALVLLRLYFFTKTAAKLKMHTALHGGAKFLEKILKKHLTTLENSAKLLLS